VNAAQTPNTSTASVVAPTVATYIRSQEGFGYFPGTIDDVRIYNRALTAAEVKQLYKLGTVTVHSN
jgi:hypothetical protein